MGVGFRGCNLTGLCDEGLMKIQWKDITTLGRYTRLHLPNSLQRNFSHSRERESFTWHPVQVFVGKIMEEQSP